LWSFLLAIVKPLLRSYWTIASLVILLALLCFIINFLMQRLSGINLILVGGGTLSLILAFLIVIRKLSLLKVAGILIKLRASLPSHSNHEVTIQNLNKAVRVAFDQYGIPTISAESQADAMIAWGYVSARDRLFQMDLLRRESAGRLSEIFGLATIESDAQKRVIGFNRIVKKIVSAIPDDQKEVLQAYSAGVNAYISQMKRRPFEFLALGYQPEPWSIEDCLLAVLTMFQLLCGDDSKKRMLTIMEELLPSQVVAFLTPDTDPYSSVLGWGNGSHRPTRPVPVKALASILKERKNHHDPPLDLVRAKSFVPGSNCWAVNKSKTANDKAILANDMHLELAVPNIWYRLSLSYEGVNVSGVMIPGVPLVLAGSNHHVAWGLTNLGGDCLDLVQLEINDEIPNEYLTPDGWKPFEMIEETIRTRGGYKFTKDVKTTVWGPVCESPLLNRQVALRWTALEADCVDIGFMHMNTAGTIEEAIRVANRFAGPPLNVIMADESGRIAYTLCGKLPVRRGFDGSVVRSWADGTIGWDGYIPPDELPSVTEPSSGHLVSANNKVVGQDYPYILGHNFEFSYRAHRIARRLDAMEKISEADMLDLQFDTVSHFYEFYRRLALDVLTEGVVTRNAEMAAVRNSIVSWDGKAEPDSQGLILLVVLREILARDTLTPYLEGCRDADKGFVYSWSNLDTPLMLILEDQPLELIPDPGRYQDWDSFILASIERSLQRIKETFKLESLNDLAWKHFNRANINHPLFQETPFLRRILNMADDALAGCNFSVCVSSPSFGASMRMVVSPGKESDGTLHMPCGQAGHPLSINYEDQHPHWARLKPLPFLPGQARYAITLKP
jgi:penicillin amidase